MPARQPTVLVLFLLSLSLLWAQPGEASTFIGPQFVIVEAQVTASQVCPPHNPRVDGTEWLLDRPVGCVLYRARPRRVLELISNGRQDPAPFLRGEIYLSATPGAFPRKGRILLLFHPLPLYGGKLLIVGQRIHPRVVQPDAQFFFTEINSLSEQSAGTLRLLLRWSRWQIGKLAAGAQESYSLLLDLHKSCLDKSAVVPVKECAAYADFQHVQGTRTFRTNRLRGTLELARQHYENGQGFFSGQLALVADGNPEFEDSVGQQQLHFQVEPDGEFTRLGSLPP